MQLPNEIINHILGFRPPHPLAQIIKAKHQEFIRYRLPDGNPAYEPDKNGIMKRFSSASIRNCPSFKRQHQHMDIPHEYKLVSFSEWLLYFLPNQKELWYEYYYES